MRLPGVDELLGAGEALHAVAVRLQQPAQRISHGLVVIDDKDCFLCGDWAVHSSPVTVCGVGACAPPLLGVRLSNRQTAVERGACDVTVRFDVVDHPQTAAMRFDNRTADVQPHAHAIGLGAVKRFKQTLGRRFVDARPLVDDADADEPGVEPHNHADHRIDCIGPRIVHRFGCILQQVHEHLLDQHRVDVDHRQRANADL
jgi:hypothetical protein